MGVVQRKQDRWLEAFEDTHRMWTERRLTQAQAAEMLGVCERAFWTYLFVYNIRRRRARVRGALF